MCFTGSTVLSIEKLKKYDPTLEELPDEEIIKLREQFYNLGQLIFDDWLESKGGSKYPTRVLQELKESNKIKV